MGTIANAFEAAFPLYVIPNVPASGAAPAVKALANGLGTVIESSLSQYGAGQTVAQVRYATLSAMNTDHSQANNTLGYVYDDPTPSNNGLYWYSTGTSTWTLSVNPAQVAVAAETTRAEAAEAILTSSFAQVSGAANVFDQSTPRWLYGKPVLLAGVDASYRKGWAITNDGYFYAKYAVGTGIANGLSWAYNPITGFHQISLGSIDGLLPIGSSSGAYIDATGDRYYKGKKVLWGVADPVYRASIIVTSDGDVYIPKLQSAASGQLQGLDAAGYLFQTQPVGSLTEIFRYSKTTGLPTQATSSGNNVNPVLSADGANVIYSTDRNGYSQLYFQPVAGGVENPVITLPGLIALGDSRSTPSQGYISALSALYPSRYADEGEGVGGQRSDEIAARFGAKTINYVVSGNSIPASGSVGVTVASGSPDPFWHWDTSLGAIHGSISGVPGTLSYSSGTESFLRDTAGSAVSVSNPVAFIPDSGTIQGSTSANGAPTLLSLDQNLCIICAGYNDINNGVLNPNGYTYTQANTLANIAAMVAKITPLVKHVFVMGIFVGEAALVNGTGGLSAGQSTLGVAASTADSQAALNDIAALNTALAAAYPNNFIDLQAGFIAAGYGETATVNGTNYTILNSTLLSDGVHTTTSATQLVYADIIQAAINAKGW